MNTYQALAKKYRPQKFADVIAQDTTVQTLKNAIRFNKVSHAYLFCGTRGTGKTTLARLFAKAINCKNRVEDEEPCNSCTSCKEIMSGHSLDVMEIDGASNRGIDDIRNLNETVGYASSTGGYKIYIIDEVHMLTKEAFNALLKTLEEPPEHVLFFFATTEPHKVLPTVISRCQRFDLRRLSPKQITVKLEKILEDVEVNIDEEALKLIAVHAEGSLRDAESLLDQLLCFQENHITVESVSQTFGLISRELFFKLDEAAANQNLSFAFGLVEKVYNQGCHFEYFLENLAEHYRQILLTKLSEQLDHHLSENEKKKYQETSKHYSVNQCLEILNLLKSQFENIQKSPFKRIDLEILLIQIIHSMKKMSLESLFDQLKKLKSSVENGVLESPKHHEEKTFSSVPHKQPEAKELLEKASSELISAPATERVDATIQKKIHHEKMLHFTNVELKGSLKKF